MTSPGRTQREEQDRDRGHAAGESERGFGILPQAQPILEDFLVGPVEARIDEAFGGPAARALAGDAFEEALPVGGLLEHEGRGQEDRRLEAALAQRRIEAIAHHQGRGVERVVADRRRRRAWARGCGCRRTKCGLLLARALSGKCGAAPINATREAHKPGFLSRAGRLRSIDARSRARRGGSRGG